MDAAELDERIRRLEARLGIAEPPAWPDPNRLAAPQAWIEPVTPESLGEGEMNLAPTDAGSAGL